MARERPLRSERILNVLPLLQRGSVLVFCLAIVWKSIQAAPDPTWPHGAAVWLVTALYVAVFSVAIRKPHPGLLVVAGLLSVTMQALDLHTTATFTTLATIALAGRRDLVPGGIIAAATACGAIGASLVVTQADAASVLTAQVPADVFIFIASSSIGRLRQEQQRTAALLREVLAGRDAMVYAAKLDERARLAREMHDVLAHTLAALSIQLESTRMLAERRGGDPTLVGALDRVSRLAKEGLLEARRAVGSLRGDSLPGPDLLPSLVDEIERDLHVPATFSIEGQPREISPEARLAVYRAAQEALANIRKHAEATAVTVVLRYSECAVELDVKNLGSARPAALPGGGYGLPGMRERVELLGGRMEAGQLSDGFHVRVWIPYR